MNSLNANLAIFLLLLTGCEKSSRPSSQLSLYGEKKMAYSVPIKEAIKESCAGGKCKSVYFEEKHIPKNSKAVVLIELEKGLSLYMDFGSNGILRYTYGEKHLASNHFSSSMFFKTAKKQNLSLEFESYRKWNCAAIDHACQKVDGFFEEPLTFEKAIQEIEGPIPEDRQGVSLL